MKQARNISKNLLLSFFKDPNDIEPLRSSVVKFNMQSPPVSPSEYDISMVLGTMQVPRVRSLSTGVVPKFPSDHRELSRTTSETRPSPPLPGHSHQTNPNPSSQHSPQGGSANANKTNIGNSGGSGISTISAVNPPSGNQMIDPNSAAFMSAMGGVPGGIHQSNLQYGNSFVSNEFDR